MKYRISMLIHLYLGVLLLLFCCFSCIEAQEPLETLESGTPGIVIQMPSRVIYVAQAPISPLQSPALTYALAVASGMMNFLLFCLVQKQRRIGPASEATTAAGDVYDEKGCIIPKYDFKVLRKGGSPGSKE
jgi:hypothetical protein